jgi:hypothetical protein
MSVDHIQPRYFEYSKALVLIYIYIIIYRRKSLAEPKARE